jgi:hypothetical protein
MDEREKFDRFIFIMDDQLEGLEKIAEPYGIQLTREMDSLEKLEALFDTVTAGSPSEKKNELSVTFGRYLGEIVRETFGGKWHIPLNNPKNINFNTPVIIGHTKIDGLEFPALSVMHAYSLRKRPGLLRRAVMSQVEPRSVEIDHLEEK